MFLLRTLRYWQQRHVSFVRCAMLLVLLSVTAAGMPRWIVHAHAANHGPTSVVAMDGHGVDAHDADAGNLAEETPDGELPDGEPLHGHYIGAFSSVVPSMFLSVLGDAPQLDNCPPGQVSPLCEGHLATLYRPPIV